jgi:hypothetical protein
MSSGVSVYTLQASKVFNLRFPRHLFAPRTGPRKSVKQIDSIFANVIGPRLNLVANRIHEGLLDGIA